MVEFDECERLGDCKIDYKPLVSGHATSGTHADGQVGFVIDVQSLTVSTRCMFLPLHRQAQIISLCLVCSHLSHCHKAKIKYAARPIA